MQARPFAACTDLYDSPVAIRSPSTWAMHARRTAARKLQHLSLMAIDNLKVMQIDYPLPFQASDLAVQHGVSATQSLCTADLILVPMAAADEAPAGEVPADANARTRCSYAMCEPNDA